MTVRELIKELKKVDKDIRICLINKNKGKVYSDLLVHELVYTDSGEHVIGIFFNHKDKQPTKTI